MADGGYASQYLPAMSHLMGEVEQPTNTQGLMNPQFGGSPEQLMGILQHPQTQALLGQLGVHFDPSTIRQSPFLPNQFMQQHPLFGHMANQAMANMAATPEAPLVSGAGSGITRAMQGMSGGPEMLRQYQVRQMLAPFQAMGATIPGQEFQRKQHLLDLLTKMEQDRQAQASRGLDIRQQEDLQKLQIEGQKRDMNKPWVDPAGRVWLPHGSSPQQPPQVGQMQGPGALPGVMAPMGPGAPAQEPGFSLAGPELQLTPEQISRYTGATHPERQSAAEYKKALIDAGVPEAEADERTAKAYESYKKGDEARTKAEGGGKTPFDWEKRYAEMDKQFSDKIRALEAYIQMPDDKVTPDQKALYAQQIDQLNQQREQEKAKIDAARGAPGASVPYLPEKRYQPKGGQAPPQVSPGAQATGAAPPVPAAPQPNPQAQSQKIW